MTKFCTAMKKYELESVDDFFLQEAFKMFLKNLKKDFKSILKDFITGLVS